MMATRSEELTFRFALVAVAVLAVVAYLPSLQAQLVSDDFFFVYRPWSLNPFVLIAGTWGHQGGPAVVYRPVTQWSYALNQALHSQAWAFHIANVAMHAAAAVLSTLVVRGLGGGHVAAIVAGLCFALHPAHHEGVAWISGRTVVLSTALSLAALLAVTARRDPTRWAVTPAVFAGLAILSYEGTAVLPALLAVAAFASGSRTIRDQIRILAPVIVVWIVYFCVRWGFVSSPSADAWALSSAVHAEGLAPPVFERAASNTQHVIARVLAAGIAVPPLHSITFWMTSLVVLASVALVSRTRRFAPALAAVLAIGALAFVPYVTFTGYADRFAYFCSLAVCGAIGIGVQAAWSRGALVRVAACSAVLVMCALWGRQLLIAQGDWIEAGRVAEAIPRQVREAVPEPGHAAHLHVIGAPLNIRGAYVFITYFHLAMAQAYGRDDMTFTMDPDTRATCDTGGARDADWCLRWDATARRVRLERSAR